MFWYIGQEQNGYVFVYDDTDRSVEFVSVRRIEELGVAIEGVKPFCEYLSTAKLKLYGFKCFDSGGGLDYKICKYSLGYVNVILSLRISSLFNNCYVKLSFYNSKSGYTYSISESPLFGFAYSTSHECAQRVPAEMIDYIMSLKSKHDFNGIMNAYSGLIGSDIQRVIRNITVREVQLIKWYN